MKYTLDTIPVWDAFQDVCECPLCKLRIACEDQYITTVMSSAYMEPEWRKHSNETGFCVRHFDLMYHRRNRLGLALITQTHIQSVIDSLEKMIHNEPKGSALRKVLHGNSKGTLASKVRLRMNGCVICEQVENAMMRYAYTVTQLYCTNNEFKGIFDNSKGVCLPHFAIILEAAEQTLSTSQYARFSQAISSVVLNNLRRTEHDLLKFTQKFDYRNAAVPWDNCQDAVERGINRLMGACVGIDANMPPHND